MKRTVAIAVAVVGMLFGAQVASAQYGGLGSPGFGGGEFGGGIVNPVAEPPHSVFNEVIRRYRFDLGEAPVTAETVETFNLYFDENSDEKIIGSYADVETNMLVVVAPPNAELDIRFALARLYVRRQGSTTRSLAMQQRELEHRRRELLFDMASLEIQSVGKEEGIDQLRDRLGSLEQELAVVEKQLEIVARYNARSKLNRKKPARASRADDPFAGDEPVEDQPDPFGNEQGSSKNPFE